MSPGERGRLRVAVDAERCEGHGRCYTLAPELFEPDELGNSQVVGDGLVPAKSEEQARLAEANCPERAVTLSRPEHVIAGDEDRHGHGDGPA